MESERTMRNRKIGLAITEQVRKDAQEKMEMVWSHIQPAVQKIKEMQDMFNSIHKEPELLYFPNISPPRPATAEDIANILNEHIKSRKTKVVSSNHELLFNRKDQALSRFIGNKKLTYGFKDGKRFPFLDLIFSFGEYVPTRTLMKDLGCPTENAIHKLSGGINNQAKISLKISDKLIEGRGGLGYRINPNFTILEE